MNNILKAWQEEKAIRRELEEYVREKGGEMGGVWDELDRLKK